MSVYPSSVLDAPAVESESSVDFVEELRLRTHARKHYISREDRKPDLHPIVLDEMLRVDREMSR
ncbi:MAG: hypothetical protein CMJ78_21740 [Planctomycetaceae bacterium]|nr:hypothetical protein [Planctomycetaceae bacterium]